MEIQNNFMLMSLQELSSYLIEMPLKGFRKITHIQNHHTWSPSYRNFNGFNHFAKLTSMEADHLSRKFKMIGQHFTTFPDGKVAVCRPLKYVPAGIEGHNTGGICLEHLGNFDKGGDAMTPVHKQAILQLNALLCQRFKLPVNTDTVVYHHWFRQGDGYRDNAFDQLVAKDHKTCPGTGFFGGNLVKSAEENFIPQVIKAYSSLSQEVCAAVKKGIVNVEALNIRKGPGTGYDISGQLKRGDLVSVFGTQDNWDWIGDDQWVSADYVALHSKAL
jgi:hypothetical protein